MKFLTNKEYEDLKRRALGDGENKEVKTLKEEIQYLRKSHAEEVEHLNKEKINLEKDNEIIVKRKDLELSNKIEEATRKFKDELATTKMDLNNKAKEVEILTKAFENLGFDVKDMKEILNKLVDGIVSKNTIQLVK